MKLKTKKLVLLSILTACAVILSYVEMLVPPLFPAVPGIKMGLANIITVFLLYKFSYKEAFLVALCRILIITLLFSNALTFIYSISGAVLSIAVMALLKKVNRFSTVGVSIAGAVFHNLAQVIVAALIMQTAEIVYYMAALTISGIIAGIAIGLLGSIFIKYSSKFKI